MRKTKKLLNEIIQELESNPITSSVCNKFNISRNTYYRWRKEDEEFSKKVREAMSLGQDYINDMAESQVIKKIQEGDNSMTQFWLRNNKAKYYSRTRVEAMYRPSRLRGW